MFERIHNTLMKKECENIKGINYNPTTRKYEVDLTTPNGTFHVGEYVDLKSANRALHIASNTIKIVRSHFTAKSPEQVILENKKVMEEYRRSEA